MPDETSPSTVTPAKQLLPLLEITPEQFQSFCRDFVAVLPGVIECHQYGVLGDPQEGIDLVATMDTDDTQSHQCRRVRSFGPAKLVKLVNETTFEAAHYFVLLACRATTTLRKEEKKHPLWTVWDVDDISGRVRALPVETARRLVRTTIGPQWCRLFLGIEPFTALVPADEFFARLLDKARLFHHAYELVGRADELRDLRTFSTDNEKRIFVLPGRGGIGKSRILRELARCLRESHHVYFVQTDMDITAEALNELPLSKTMIVVDDAHRRKDLGLLISYATRTGSKLVMATRPQLRDELPSLAARHHIESSEIVVASDLQALDYGDVETLAREVLGQDFQSFAPSLAAASADCPLITIVGGRLLREKRLLPTLLADDTQFRETVLARFFDEIVEDAMPGSDEARLRRLLEVIAALAPVRISTERFAAAAASLAGMDHEIAASWCERLEKQGILASRLDGLRIVPDVLSDYILGRACEQKNGSKFVEGIVQAVGSLDGALLRNLASVDWRVGRKTGQELKVLGAVWDEITKTFRGSSSAHRKQMLRDLKEVGYFLPSQMLSLAKLAFDFPAGEETENGHEPVLAQLPEVVRFTAFSPNTFDAACDFLWRLANDRRIRESRGLGERGALAILCDIMAPGLRKPRWVHEKLLTRVEAWQDIAESPRERAAIALILSSLFAKTGMDTWSDDDKITTRSYALSPAYLRGLRERARKVLEDLLSDKTREVVAAAVRAFGNEIRPPFEFMGITISDQVRAEWLPDRIAAIDQLHALAESNRDPVIGELLRDTVGWYADDDSAAESALREAATRVIDAQRTDVAHRVARVIRDPWGTRSRQHRDPEAAALRLKQAAQEVISLGAEAAMTLIADTTSGLLSLELNPTPGPLLSAIVQEDGRFGAHLTTLVVAESSAIAGYVSSLLFPLREIDRDAFNHLVQRIAMRGDRLAAASVLSAYAWWVDEASLTDPDLENIKGLSAFGGEVERQGYAVLPKLAKVKPDAAVDLLLRLNLRDDQQAAEELATAFQEPEHALFDALGGETLAAVIAKFEHTPQIDGVHLGDFIEQCGRRDPIAVIELLVRRIEGEDRLGVSRLTAIPLEPPRLEIPPDIAASDRYKALLRRIEAHFETGRAYEAHQLFSIAAGDMNVSAIEFMRRLSARQTEAATNFLGLVLRGPKCREVLLSDANFVEQLLNDGAAAGSKMYENLLDAMATCIVPRATTGQFRADIREQVATARDQLPIQARARDLYLDVVSRLDRIDSSVQTGREEGEEDIDDDLEDE
ncbi:MAG TPA: hypothetical protein VHT23_12415 [Gemmatimonadaceae bacterium]|jgi:hypothetical protein|nr:hypothetical protein [Gemmatimonadaceae bacterium]